LIQKGKPLSNKDDTPNSAAEDDYNKSLFSQAKIKQLSKDMKLQAKDIKRIQKSFAQLQQQQATHSNTSSDASDTESNQSHVQYATVRNDVQATSGKGKHRHGLQFTQLQPIFEPPIAQLLQHPKGKAVKLDLREVLLLDSQSTVDLLCNRDLVKRTFRSNKRMRLKSNGGTMVITKKAEISGYHAHVWYNKHAMITNILSLSNVIKQYPVTYDSADKMFVVHRESVGKTNMEFWMHKSGIHYYDPRNDESPFHDDAIPGVTDAEIPGVHTTDIPGVTDAEIPAVFPGRVDGDAEHAPDKAEPVESAPIAQSAELQRSVVAAMEDGSDRNVEAANTVRNAVKSTEDGSDAANQVGHEAANDDGYEAADDWIEVLSKKHLRGKRILRGHPKDGVPLTANFPVVKIATHAPVWSTRNVILLEKTGMALDMAPGKPSDNEGFYTTKMKSILRTHRKQIDSKIVRFTARESGTHRVARKNAGLVLTVSANHHRSVLGAVAPRQKNARTEVVKHMGVVNEPTGPRGRLTQLKRNNRMRQPITTVDGHVLV
jgi:hypothetical protein